MTTLIIFALVILAVWNVAIEVRFHGQKAVIAETESLLNQLGGGAKKLFK